MCVLIVEDELLIRLIVAEEFSEAGLEVCEAEDGDRATALIENPPTPFTLLVTDIHIPGERDGIEVARLMRQRYPTVPVIYTTGRPDVLDRMKHGFGSQEAVVIKPFVASQLVAVAHRLLGTNIDNRRH